MLAVTTVLLPERQCRTSDRGHSMSQAEIHADFGTFLDDDTFLSESCDDLQWRPMRVPCGDRESLNLSRMDVGVRVIERTISPRKRRGLRRESIAWLIDPDAWSRLRGKQRASRSSSSSATRGCTRIEHHQVHRIRSMLTS